MFWPEEDFPSSPRDKEVCLRQYQTNYTNHGDVSNVALLEQCTMYGVFVCNFCNLVTLVAIRWTSSCNSVTNHENVVTVKL